MVILGCGKDDLIVYTFSKRGGGGNWPADVDVDFDTGQNICHFCFLVTAAYVDVDVDSEFPFLTFSFAYDADVDVDVDALQGLLQYYGLQLSPTLMSTAMSTLSLDLLKSFKCCLSRCRRGH